jgi:hypothetical protein
MRSRHDSIMVGVHRVRRDPDRLLAVGRQRYSCQAVRPSSPTRALVCLIMEPTRALVCLVMDSTDEKADELVRARHHADSGTSKVVGDSREHGSVHAPIVSVTMVSVMIVSVTMSSGD